MRRGRRAAAIAALALAACAEPAEDRWFGSTDRSGRDPATFYVNNYGEPASIDPGVAR
jgi:ABC-type oligopeptide transport system substrate-binding subunit